MKKMTAKGQKWLKGFHIFFVCMWIGAAVCLSIMNPFLRPKDGSALYGICFARDKGEVMLKGNGGDSHIWLTAANSDFRIPKTLPLSLSKGRMFTFGKTAVSKTFIRASLLALRYAPK